MARSKKHPAVGRAPSTDHVALAEYITAKTGVEVLPEMVALVQRLVPEYRKSPNKKAEIDSRKAQRDADRAEVENRKEARLAERRAKLIAQLEALGGTAPNVAVAPVVEDEDEDDDDGGEEEADHGTIVVELRAPAKKKKIAVAPVVEDEDEDDDDDVTDHDEPMPDAVVIEEEDEVVESNVKLLKPKAKITVVDEDEWEVDEDDDENPDDF